MKPSAGESPPDPRSVETTFVPVDGTRLYCRIVGDGPPLVFVNAGITDGRLWERQLDAFADQYRVVAYDLRGYGQSDFPPRPYAHHRDLGQLLDALDIDSAHFVGASMGGAAVLDFALVHPDRVASLALVAPALSGYEFTDETTKRGWAEAGAAFEAGELERAATIESETWLAGPSRTLDEVDADSRELVWSMLLRSYELENDDAAEEGLQPPAIDRLDELSVPVLLVLGKLDTPDMKAIAERIERDAPTVRVETMADVAHLPSLERPVEFDELLRSFLEQVGDSRP